MTIEHDYTVTELLAWAIRRSGKTQAELAKEIGFEKPNILSMIVKGHTRLPMQRVPAFAEALEIDGAYLMRLVLFEYEKELFDIIVHCVGHIHTENERTLLDVYRRVAPNDEIRISGNHIARLLLTFDSMRLHPNP